MGFQSVTKITLAGGVLMAFVYACSGPDPGEVIFVQRTQDSTGNLDGGGGPGPVTDGGGGGPMTEGGSVGEGGAMVDSGPLGAFTGAPAYAAGTPSSGNAKDQAAHKTTMNSAGVTPPNGDPSGMNCADSKCHATGGGASPWTYAGTAYIAAGMPAPMGVEIRVVDGTGKEIDHVYTDVGGNFYSQGQTAVPAGAFAGARNGTKTNSMPGASANCNTSGCHLAAANPMLQ